jgi:hypothetical protein
MLAHWRSDRQRAGVAVRPVEFRHPCYVAAAASALPLGLCTVRCKILQCWYIWRSLRSASTSSLPWINRLFTISPLRVRMRKPYFMITEGGTNPSSFKRLMDQYHTPSISSTQIYDPAAFFPTNRVLAASCPARAPAGSQRQAALGNAENKTAGIKPAVLRLQFDL